MWQSAQEAASGVRQHGTEPRLPTCPLSSYGPLILTIPALLSSSVCAGNGTSYQRGLPERLNEMMLSKISPQRRQET